MSVYRKEGVTADLGLLLSHANRKLRTVGTEKKKRMIQRKRKKQGRVDVCRCVCVGVCSVFCVTHSERTEVSGALRVSLCKISNKGLAKNVRAVHDTSNGQRRRKGPL